MFLQLILKLLGLFSSSIEEQPKKLIDKIVTSMDRKNYPVDKGDGEINIVYVKGCNADGTANNDEPGSFNDQRIVFQYERGTPRVLGQWDATVDPGPYYVRNRINAGGAAQIAFGYHYQAWQVGIHRGNHEALVQTGGPVTVYRDNNEDFSRDGDRTENGYFGINQHWGYDLDTTDKASAGCLVGQTKVGHVAFMGLVKSDARYKANHSYKFSTTVLQYKDL